MSYPSEERMPQPVTVSVNNWPENAKQSGPPRNTTYRTLVLDPAGTAGPTFEQIAGEEPTRIRMVLQVLDTPVAILGEVPRSRTDTSTASAAPMQGRVLPANTGVEYIFYGTDPKWVNNLGTIGRVTITKEYQ